MTKDSRQEQVSLQEQDIHQLACIYRLAQARAIELRQEAIGSCRDKLFAEVRKQVRRLFSRQ